MSSDSNGEKDVKMGVSIQADFKPVLESAPSGFKRVFQILFGGRHARVERLSRLTEAQTDVDVKKILRGEVQYDPSQNGFVHIEPTQIQSFIAQDIDNEETANLITCSMHAAVIVEASEDNASEHEEISRDFVLKWRNEAKYISDETAQAIWGRILAEEIQDPGSISPRSLDVIKNLSKSEALLFNKACSYIAFEKLLIDNTKGNVLEPEEFTSLRDAGLIASYTQGIYRGTTWPDTSITLRTGEVIPAYFVKVGKYFIFVNKDEIGTTPAPSFSYWELTKPARELYKIVSPTIDTDINMIIKSLTHDEVALKFRYTTYTDFQKNGIDTDNIRDLQPLA